MKGTEKLKNIGSFCQKISRAIFLRSWYLTILFFLVIFGFSLYIWWNCVYQPLPSQAVKDKFAQNQQDFRLMNQKIEKVISKLKEKEDHFSHPQELPQQRELFVNKNLMIETPKPKAPTSAPKTPSKPAEGGKSVQ